MTILLIYVAIFIIAYFAVAIVKSLREQAHDFTSLKTVTFGDESAVRANRTASIISVITIFLIWGRIHRVELGSDPCSRALCGRW